jgi:membrane protein
MTAEPLMRDVWPLVKGSVQGWMEDNASSLGAALAFYTLLSLAPLALIIIAVAGFFIGSSEAHDLLVAQLTQLMDEQPAQTVATIVANAKTRTSGVLATIFGIAALLAGATTVFVELRRDLDIIWRSRPEKARTILDFLLTRALALGVVLGIGFLLLVSLAASTAISALSSTMGSHAVARAGEFVGSFAVVTLLFAAIYKLLPNRSIAWGDVWVGAAVTSLLFWIGKYLIGLYLGKAAVGSAYGAAGAVVVVIVWVYYSAQIFFLGAEFTREYATRHGSKRGDVELQQPPANEDMVERAQNIVKGEDPVLLRKKP